MVAGVGNSVRAAAGVPIALAKLLAVFLYLVCGGFDRTGIMVGIATEQESAPRLTQFLVAATVCHLKQFV